MTDYHLASEKGNCRQIADSVRKNMETGAMLMDQGDTFTVILSLNIEQTGEIADSKVMREHLARQLALIAVYLAAP